MVRLKAAGLNPALLYGGFQFLMVRLKDCDFTSSRLIHFVSIPYGTIKSFFNPEEAFEVFLFQFLMVRLKELI